MSGRLCVIGDPVAHSKSPLIQNTMLSALGLPYIYSRERVGRTDTALWLRRAEAEGYAGFNATMPHKEQLLPLMDHLDEDARMYGAVNTVCRREGEWWGFNTDGRGFLASLEEAGIPWEGRTVTLLGAGGAASAVGLKLAQAGAGEVLVCNRTRSRAEALCQRDRTGRLRPAERSGETLGRTDLLINCTGLGMTGSGQEYEDLSFVADLPQGAAVCDLIYAPAETKFLQEAKRLGHPTLNGLGMLIFQAIFALEHFTQQKIDGRAMLPLVKKALQGG